VMTAWGVAEKKIKNFHHTHCFYNDGGGKGWDNSGLCL